ncbi:MAG: citramalate synthase [Balneolaceae bacterium]
MSKKIQIFDTTLRDGTQGEKVCLSANDKVRIAKRLDSFGVDYIEGGWPGSNPKDLEFFKLAKNVAFNHAKIVAFGSTCRAGLQPDEDKNIQFLLDAETDVVSIFGKSWLLHVVEALKISPEENLDIIRRSVQYLKENGKEVIYDAEHFFDGYKDNPEYALETLTAAQNAGADTLVLCDTNGGTLTHEISEIIQQVRDATTTKMGIHAHNDCELAVSNSVAAVSAGCVHVQGTINGYGERCGNANLCSVIPNLQLKQNFSCVPDSSVGQLTSISSFVSELANVGHDTRMPYTGRSAFAHKGGVHVSAVMKNEATYEHVKPEDVGNKRRVLVSDLSGKSNVVYKSEELGIDLENSKGSVPEIVEQLKKLENEGFQFEAAEASFELLVKKMTEPFSDLFELEGFRVIMERDASGESRSEATIRVNVQGQLEHSAAEGNGPVHALDSALRKALCKFYPDIADVILKDYKVRVLNEKDGTGAKVRVLVDSGKNETSWGTVGVSKNIVDASWQALADSMNYYLMHHSTQSTKNQEARDEVQVH